MSELITQSKPNVISFLFTFLFYFKSSLFTFLYYFSTFRFQSFLYSLSTIEPYLNIIYFLFAFSQSDPSSQRQSDTISFLFAYSKSQPYSQHHSGQSPFYSLTHSPSLSANHQPI